MVPVCLTSVDSFWPMLFFVGSIVLFFVVPLVVLIILYTVIAQHLMNNPGITSHGNRSNVLKYRKQVILMLGAVVASFFVCLLPFRALTLWIIIMPAETIMSLGLDGYYMLIYFCRVMLYLNSAMNPILYNLMSSKFREGFLRLLKCQPLNSSKYMITGRNGTFHTTSTNLSSSQNGAAGSRSGRTRSGGGDSSDSDNADKCQKYSIPLATATSVNRQTKSNAAVVVRNSFIRPKAKVFKDILESEEEELQSTILPNIIMRCSSSVHIDLQRDPTARLDFKAKVDKTQSLPIPCVQNSETEDVTREKK